MGGLCETWGLRVLLKQNGCASPRSAPRACGRPAGQAGQAGAGAPRATRRGGLSRGGGR
ncbi:hypothetical protein ACFPRL_13190 [Pseudoclavibacter helvolus]